MTTKRKAELQRKLAIAPVPKPPAGLAERIKRDIPADLRSSVERERERFKRSNLFSLRVAASILLLVGGAFLAVQLLSRAGAPGVESKMASRQSAPLAVSVNKKKSVEIAQAPAAEPSFDKVSSGSLQKSRSDQQDERRKLADVSNVAAAPPPAAARGRLEEKDKVNALTGAEPVAMADAQVDAKEQAAAGRDREGIVAGAAAKQEPAALRAAAAPMSAPAAKSAISQDIATRSELFGVSVDRQAFDRIKSAIERGERPAASTVDVAALVNYFAGQPARMRRDVALDLEASSRPVNGSSTSLVRLSVDTSAAISDATLDITFDPLAVSAHRRVGGDVIGSAMERIVPASRSVTALYEVTLRPNVRAHQAVATATLTYRSPDGRQQTRTRWVSYNEAVGPWSNRSRRHRLATLGAIWGETLQARANGAEVARKAEELSKQEPGDEKAKELATLATASSRLQSSSPTGSGR